MKTNRLAYFKEVRGYIQRMILKSGPSSSLGGNLTRSGGMRLGSTSGRPSLRRLSNSRKASRLAQSPSLKLL